MVDWWRDEGWWIYRITWIEEKATQLLGSSAHVLDHRKVCITSKCVVIVHSDLEISALKVGICGIDPEATTTSPKYLQDTQEDWGEDGASRQLTDEPLRGCTGVGGDRAFCEEAQGE
jgi:hypothetical protein